MPTITTTKLTSAQASVASLYVKDTYATSAELVDRVQVDVSLGDRGSIAIITRDDNGPDASELARMFASFLRDDTGPDGLDMWSAGERRAARNLANRLDTVTATRF